MASQPEVSASSHSGDSALIRELATLLDETNLTEIEIERAGLRVRVARNVSIATAVPAAMAQPGCRRPWNGCPEKDRRMAGRGGDDDPGVTAVRRLFLSGSTFFQAMGTCFPFVCPWLDLVRG